MKKVLIAEVESAHEELAACFEDMEVTLVERFDLAVELLSKQSFDLVIIGVHFDGLRMFDLLAAIHSRGLRMPVVCVKAAPTFLSSEAQRALDAAVKALGAKALVDLGGFGAKEFRELVASLCRV